jgi:hypothetical protein
MAVFLFWNLNRKPIQNLVGKLAAENEVDILVLAECTIGIAQLLEALNNGRKWKYSLAFSPSTRVLVLSRFPHTSITPMLDAGGISIRRVRPPVGIEIILVAVHLSSKLYQEGADQALTATRIARYIEQVERVAGHTRTIVFGDLNMNPFEAGVVGAEALHAVMDRTVAKKVSRIVGGEPRNYFYNPMWGRLGDGAPGPAGTYYRYGSQQINYFWNTYDQVLLRPELLERFPENDLKVITSIESVSLLDSNGVPNTAVASDHLPIRFRLILEDEGGKET